MLDGEYTFVVNITTQVYLPSTWFLPKIQASDNHSEVKVKDRPIKDKFVLMDARQHLSGLPMSAKPFNS